MADVDRSRDGVARDERGQLFIVGALALAVILVALAVLLNTAIYTGNVATRDTGIETTSVVEYDRAAVAMAETTLESVNYRNNTDYAHLELNASAGIAAWSTTTARHVVLSGGDASVTMTRHTDGTRIVQDAQRNFTNAAEATNWTLAGDVHVRNYSVSVVESTLPTITDADDDVAGSFGTTFRVVVTDTDGDSWEVYIYDQSGPVKVTVVENDATLRGSCSTTTDDPTVDLTNASLAGTHCDALAFWADADAPYTIEYQNAGSVEGTYSLVVDKDGSTLDTSDYHADDIGNSPYFTPALYSVEVRVTYHSPSVYYQTTHRVAPGDADA